VRVDPLEDTPTPRRATHAAQVAERHAPAGHPAGRAPASIKEGQTLSLDHSFYAVYGVELAETDWLVVYDGLEAQRRSRHEDDTSEDDTSEDVQLYTVSGNGRRDDRVIIGVGYEELPPGACKSAKDLEPSPERDKVLLAAAATLPGRALDAPGWLLVHDWS
jgi:hypothetical protein